MQVRVALVPWKPEPLLEAVQRAGAQVVDDVAEADAIVWLDPTDPEGLRRARDASRARWIQLPFAGVEQFFAAGAIDAARTWTCAKGIYGPSTAEHAFALTLLAARQLQRHARAQAWGPITDEPIRRLQGATALLVGTGGIGEAYARYAAPFGMHIVAANRSGNAASWAELTVPSGQLISLIPAADFVVVAAAATPQTRSLIDARVIDAMKPDAWLVNVARGTLVDTEALVAALRARKIGGAALDVTDPEPLPAGHPLWDLDNAIVTSHLANTLKMAMPDLAALTERNLSHFIAGEPLEGLVDVSLGY